MTANQIITVLKEIGNYDIKTLIPLNEVSSIVLNIDQNIYPNDNTRFNFYIEPGIELLLVYSGYTNEDNEFVANKLPDYFISLSTIFGFNLKSHIRPSEPYKFGMAV